MIRDALASPQPGRAPLTTTPAIRLDALALAPPRQLDDGTRVYDAVLVYAGRPLQYGWGEEVPTPEALQSPAYLAGLKGISVVLHHPASKRIEQGRAPKRGDGKRAGTVIDARWEPNEGEQGAVVISMAVHEQGDQAEVERLRGVSEGYAAEVQAGRQTARVPNHVAITATPRAEGAQIRVDEMPDEKNDAFREAYNDMIRRQDKLERERDDAIKRADKAEKAMADAAKQADEEAKAKADEDKKRADAREAEIDRLANERAADLLKLQTRADSLKVSIPETAVTLADRKAALATALGCPEGTDHDAWIAATEKARTDSAGKGAAAAFAASAVRTDSDDSDSFQWSV